jgi:hypothetical protein
MAQRAFLGSPRQGAGPLQKLFINISFAFVLVCRHYVAKISIAATGATGVKFLFFLLCVIIFLWK